MAEECCGGLGKRAPAVLDMENGLIGVIDREMIESLFGVSDDAESSGGDGFLDEAIAVGRAAFHGHKNGAGAHAARVVFDAGNGHGGAAG